ncbi:MAG: hypothetical protein A2286_09840 [Gammaproteobacteria bacterium RIFOXYA12_FULL_61_12]|nr:MAG: hypothetical protein A2514_02755 [Gammaproteobacteria bacterium RIFOXYD12_FULL_61_37]OGT90501.1 MAG: hypothetical protein A2286_09840 [Gammaproteobacteria bacterium RIFOXYA12_FULL_61_12]
MEKTDLNRFGYKIVDRDYAAIEPILADAAEHLRPVEVGLYFKDGETHSRLRTRLGGPGQAVVTHLDHRKLSVYSHLRHEPLMREQIETSLALGAGYAINHVAPYPMSPRPDYQSLLLERLSCNLERLDHICREYGFSIHIENTFHGIGFYRRIFQQIRLRGLDRLHFCFDIGHAKVWSTSSLGEWMEFLDELNGQGFNLHMHLHANSGLMDEHLSLPEAERLGYTQPDVFTGNWGFHEAISRLDQRFPKACKIFEVPTGEALENMSNSLARMAGIRAEAG